MIVLLFVICSFIAVASLSIHIGTRIGVRTTCEYLFNVKEMGKTRRGYLEKIIDRDVRDYKYACLSVHYKHNR